MNNTDTPATNTSPTTSTPMPKEQWLAICHYSTFAGLIIPMGNIIGPLLVMLIKKHEIPEVEYHAKEAINFQLTVTIAVIGCMLLSFLILPFFAAFAIVIADIYFTVMAAMAASKGEKYKYPYTLRLVK